MYRCTVCEKAYTWPHDLNRHVKHKHMDQQQAAAAAAAAAATLCLQTPLHTPSLPTSRDLHRVEKFTL